MTRRRCATERTERVKIHSNARVSFPSISNRFLLRRRSFLSPARDHRFQNLHQVSKQQISEFVRGHFYGCLDFDLDNTLYFFTAGRYEYRNKGVDLFIEALARESLLCPMNRILFAKTNVLSAGLNYRLKQSGSKLTVVAFLIMPAKTNSYNIEVLKGQAVTKQLRDTVTEIQNRVGARLFEKAARYTGFVLSSIFYAEQR